ncbi:CDP-alcohol phosphatidyltransferase family protein [Thermodesulfobacteriota bacterium]
MNTDAKVDPADRRPLRARNAGFWIPLAFWLDNRGVTPNAVSMTGLSAGLLTGALLVSTSFIEPGINQRIIWLLVVFAVLFRGACNILDGVMAVETGDVSPVGILWNEVPDRISDAAAFIGAGYAFGGEPILGWAAAFIAVLVSYIRVQCRVAGFSMDYSGPMAKPMRMLVVCAAAVWMATAPSSWYPRWGSSGSWGVMILALAVIIAGGVATVIRRSYRAANMLNGVQT